MSTSVRLMKGTSVLNRLKSASIVELNKAAKFQLLTTNGGNAHMREDGTLVRIFNVAAFRSDVDANLAKTYWMQGYKQELAGDVDGAQDRYREALNLMMSFSTLEQFAPQFSGCYEVTALVEEVLNKDKEKRIVLNNVRPVAVGALNKASTFDSIDLEAIAAQVAADAKPAKPAKPSAKTQK